MTTLPVPFEQADEICRRVASHLASRVSAEVDFDELYSEAWVGLLSFARLYDTSRGVSFKVYMYYRVRGHILDEMRRRYGRKDKPGSRRHPAKPVLRYDGLTRRLVSINGHKEPAESGVDLVASTEEPGYKRVDDRDEVERQLRGLSAADRSIMVDYYLNDVTMSTIARRLGLSESRVSQRHSDLMQRYKERNVYDSERSDVESGCG